ncbi:MAG: NAD(+)/NADH kinase [Oscillospiraceae bacterium]|nr:NAD(+)/NADH kinase [Oscillospiraceae bacterium]
MKIAVLPNSTRDKSYKYTMRIIDILTSLDVEIFMLSDHKKSLGNTGVSFLNAISQVVERCDISITVGGDGTITHAAKYAVLAEKPILGVNLGRIGFTATLEKNELQKLKLLVKEEYFVNHRAMIAASVIYRENGKNCEEIFYALNDIVISQAEVVKISDFTLRYNDEDFHYRSDGLIFSTPTGSTAYSLSAGGPVIDPEMSCILFSQICPYSVCQKAIVFSNKSELLIRAHALKVDGRLLVIADGRIVCEFSEREIIKIRISDKYLKLISFERQNFYSGFKKKFSAF